MTSGNDSAPLNSPSPEELVTAFKEVLDYITPLIAANPKAALRPHCPQDLLLDGTQDEVWREGQRNGEVHAARQILTILGHALGTEPKISRKEPAPIDWHKGLFPTL